MNMHRPVCLQLAAGIALSLLSAASLAATQSPPQQQVPPPPATTAMPSQPLPAAPPAQPQAPTTPPAPAAPEQPQLPQSPSQPSQPPTDQQQGTSGQFYPGTQSRATYPIPNGTLTVNAGMPAHVEGYGPPPPFKTLDSNHDGRLSEMEAQAYPPLDSDFLYASGGGNAISRTQYTKWTNAQH